MPVDLMTEQGENLLKTGETPWTVYPRPQLRRDSYLNLNGIWSLEAGGDHFSIRVPFCPESQLSGVGKHFAEGEILHYSRVFTLPKNFNRGRVLLHIGAADQQLQCFLNNRPMGSHKGGYDAITFDITTALVPGENELRLLCLDSLYDRTQPFGKQVLPEKRGGMWYTPVSGVWQTVWLESVPETYVRQLKVACAGDSVTIETEPPLDGQLTVAGEGTFLLKEGKATINLQNPNFWSPENPHLYDFELTAGADKIQSYFALRTLEIKEIGGHKRLCLNGKPYFFHGLLDQGYWPDGLFTPATPECYAEDILKMKKLGFNTLRKHIKVEPEEFYYQCDKLGMVVFQDMVNNGVYAFLRDTALPTIGIQKLNDRKMHRDEKNRAEFLRQMDLTVQQLWNHPCVCYWTIFNEGWGQFDSDAVYERLRALDDTRFIDSTSGWFRREKSDVDSRHVYFRRVKLKAGDKPLVLSEFGGYSFQPEGHVFNPEKTYGYGKFKDQAAFAAAVEKLYRSEILPAVQNGLCAAIYTQVSDVEDETNGMLSYDRKVCKLTPERMLPIARMLQEAVTG